MATPLLESYKRETQNTQEVELESEIQGDESSTEESCCMGRVWKCIKYECQPSVNGLIVFCAFASGVLATMGLYSAAPHCPVTRCSVDTKSDSPLVTSIEFGGAITFLCLAKGMCVLARQVMAPRVVKA